VPVSQNSAGDPLGHVRDDGSDPDDPTVRRYRTRVPQPFHVDGSDVVGFLCVQGAKSGGVSQIVSSVTVYNEVATRRPDLEPLLREPWFFDRYGVSTRAQTHMDVSRLADDQVDLLDLVDALAQDPELHLDMDFECGDIQLLANPTILIRARVTRITTIRPVAIIYCAFG
jgi:Taurine catabolism dioxygenase TauD, TfdA family